MGVARRTRAGAVAVGIRGARCGGARGIDACAGAPGPDRTVVGTQSARRGGVDRRGHAGVAHARSDRRAAADRSRGRTCGAGVAPGLARPGRLRTRGRGGAAGRVRGARWPGRCLRVRVRGARATGLLRRRSGAASRDRCGHAGHRSNRAVGIVPSGRGCGIGARCGRDDRLDHAPGLGRDPGRTR